jgi:hypothetical protein
MTREESSARIAATGMAAASPKALVHGGVSGLNGNGMARVRELPPPNIRLNCFSAQMQHLLHG